MIRLSIVVFVKVGLGLVKRNLGICQVQHLKFLKVLQYWYTKRNQAATCVCMLDISSCLLHPIPVQS